jgi:hypothetical protein
MRAGGSRVGLLLARTSAYPRTETHLSRQTLSGAALTVSAVLLVLCLVAAELREFLNVESSKRARRDAPAASCVRRTPALTRRCARSLAWTLRARSLSWTSSWTLLSPRCRARVRAPAAALTRRAP